MDSIIILVLTLFIIAWVTYIIALMSDKEEARDYFVNVAVICLAFMVVYFYWLSSSMLSSAFQLINGHELLNVFLASTNPAAFIILAHFMTMIFFPWALRRIIILWVYLQAITFTQAVYIYLGMCLGRSIMIIFVVTILFRGTDDFGTMFGTCLAPHIFYVMTSLILLPLEYLTGIMTTLSNWMNANYYSKSHLMDYANALLSPMTNGILEIDFEVYFARYNGTFLGKRPLPKYLCQENDFIDRCFIFAQDVNVFHMDFYEYQKSCQVSPCYFIRNEVVQNISLTLQVIGDNCIDYFGNASSAGELSIQMFSFQYPNLSSSSVKPCTHLLAGAGLPNSFVPPPGYPKLSLNETSVVAIFITTFLVLIWTCFFIYIKQMTFLCKNYQNVIRKALQMTNPLSIATDSIKARCFTLAIRLTYLVLGCCLCLALQDVNLALVLPILISSINTGSTERVVKSLMATVLGIEFGGFLTAITLGFSDPVGNFETSLQLACVGFIFVQLGCLLWYIIPFLFTGQGCFFPVVMTFATPVVRYPWWAYAYIILSAVVIPGVILAIALAGPIVFIIFALLITVLLLTVLTINELQKCKWSHLPVCLRTWDFLPVFLTSLQPYDRVIQKYACSCACNVEKVADTLYQTLVADKTSRDNLSDQQGSRSQKSRVDRTASQYERQDEESIISKGSLGSETSEGNESFEARAARKGSNFTM